MTVALSGAAKAALQAVRDTNATEKAARLAVGDNAGAAAAETRRVWALAMAAVHHDTLT